MPFCAALAWLHGTVTFAGLHRFDDPAILSFVARTQVVSDESRERYKPLIRLALKDGSTVEWLDDCGRGGLRPDLERGDDDDLCAIPGIQLPGSEP